MCERTKMLFNVGLFLSKDELLKLDELAGEKSLQEYMREVIVAHIEPGRITRDAPDDGELEAGSGAGCWYCGAPKGSHLPGCPQRG